MFQTAGDEKRKDKRSVYTLLDGVVARLRQWGGVGRRRGRRWSGPSLDLAKFHLLPHLTKVSELFVTSLQLFLPHCAKCLLTFLLLQ